MERRKKFQAVNHDKNNIITQASFISTLTRILELNPAPKKRIREFRTTHNLFKILSKLFILNLFYQIDRTLPQMILYISLCPLY